VTNILSMHEQAVAGAKVGAFVEALIRKQAELGQDARTFAREELRVHESLWSRIRRGHQVPSDDLAIRLCKRWPEMEHWWLQDRGLRQPPTARQAEERR